MTEVVAIKDMGGLPTHGRIRTGHKKGKYFEALSHFRLTSTDKAVLEQLAEMYGGEVTPWHDAKANPPNQFQLYTTSDMLKVVVMPGSVDVDYEIWAAGGIQRQCDGESVTIWTNTPDDRLKTYEPCICAKQGVRECDIKTRVNFMFPGIDFAGVWRYESKGIDAAHTLPSMMSLMEAVQKERGMIPIELHIVDREKVVGQQKRKWKVCEVRTGLSLDQMLDGQGTYSGQLTNGQTAALPAAELVLDEVELVSDEVEDDDIADAEVIEEEPAPDGVMPRAEAFQLAKDSGGKLKAKKVDGGWTVQ